MKAMVLAAGLGTRLLPHTRHLPKPLFPVGDRPLLDIHIRRLADAGCEAVLVNTHHLAEQIEAFIAAAGYSIPVAARYETEILGTGGAIRNASDFWDERPFLVVNSDILTDIDLAGVYDFHRNHSDPATLVVFDDPRFNTVRLRRDGTVIGFGGFGGFEGCGGCDAAEPPKESTPFLSRTFTGIQVLDPMVLDFIPEGVFSSSIEAYQKMIGQGLTIRGYGADGFEWRDLGDPERYRDAVLDDAAPRAFAAAFPGRRGDPVRQTPLAGDGSDRRWSRLTTSAGSLILADHGIRGVEPGTREVDAFVNIGRHLFRKAVPTPMIHWEDRFSGLVFLEDLGDVHLQSRVESMVRVGEGERIQPLYRQVIDHLLRLGIDGRDGFDPEWTWQSRDYDRSLILEKECRYFVDAFLVGFLGKRVDFRDFQSEFQAIADGVIQNGVPGLMHRDMQSRNIMVRDGRCFFIDFQGARFGPLQYDLASLLIDPYVALGASLQKQLLEDYMEQLSTLLPLDREGFRRGYEFCALTRNFQILGAFGFLSRVKGKKAFEVYIPAALSSLQERLNGFQGAGFPRLMEMISAINSSM